MTLTVSETPGDSVTWSTARFGDRVLINVERAHDDDRRHVAQMALSSTEALLLAASLLQSVARASQ